MEGIRVITKATDSIANFREAKIITLSYYQNRSWGQVKFMPCFFSPHGRRAVGDSTELSLIHI